MEEFKSHIDAYQAHTQMHFSNLVPEAEWGNRELAEAYLKKYWLSEQEYECAWKPIQDEIFIPGSSLPDLIYRPNFELLVLKGGCLFVEEDFAQFQKAMLQAGEEYFVVIQHAQDFTAGEPMFRMKFPVNISWKELTSGNYISAVLLEMSYNTYYVFGASANWGKYAANDYDHPLDIIGFKPELASVFREQFKQPKEEQEELQEWLPEGYKKLLNLVIY